jgi:hypothetical protein
MPDMQYATNIQARLDNILSDVYQAAGVGVAPHMGLTAHTSHGPYSPTFGATSHDSTDSGWSIPVLVVGLIIGIVVGVLVCQYCMENEEQEK